MKVKYKTQNGRMEFEFDAEDAAGIIEKVSQIQQIIDHKGCGACGSENFSLTHRVAKGYHFYAAKCNDCYKELSFGQLQDGSGLYPKLKNAETGEYHPDRGWVKNEFRKSDSNQDAPSQDAPTPF